MSHIGIQIMWIAVIISFIVAICNISFADYDWKHWGYIFFIIGIILMVIISANIQ